jgi:predicted nucleic acid-binding Zn ribbon protein
MSARKKPDPGWLRLQRERYGPEYRIPPEKNIQVAGDLVNGVMKKFGLETASHLADIQSAWPEIAGKDIAANSNPGTLERGTLTIYVDHHVWLNELKQMAAPMLKKKLQARFGAKKIKGLRFVITPEEET